MEIVDNLEFAGMLSTGSFVGRIHNYGFSKIKDNQSFAEIVSVIVGAAFSGSGPIFIHDIVDPLEGTHLYPIGLILALLWYQIPNTIEKYINSTK